MALVNTGGFSVQAQPGINYIDPRLMAPAYDRIIPAVGQGVGLGNSLFQIAENAAARPVRKRLGDIQLAQAENELALAPLQMARKRIELGQPIERVAGIGIEEIPRYPLQPMTDETGAVVLDINGNPRMERPAGNDVFAVENLQIIDPVTGQTSERKRLSRPISTLEQQNAAADMAEYRDQLAAIRLQQANTAAEAATAKAENDRIKADAAAARVEAALGDPKWRTVSSGEDAQGNLVINQVNAEGELRAIPTGQKKRSTNIFFGANIGGGASPASPATSASLDPDVAALAARFRGAAPATTVPPVAVVPAPIAPAAEQFTVGQTYTDSSGNKAMYLGNGQWQEIP